LPRYSGDCGNSQRPALANAAPAVRRAPIGSCACFHANTIARVVTRRTGSPLVRLPEFSGPTRVCQLTSACKHASTFASVPVGRGVYPEPNDVNIWNQKRPRVEARKHDCVKARKHETVLSRLRAVGEDAFCVLTSKHVKRAIVLACSRACLL
jgi:hypothetical protein